MTRSAGPVVRLLLAAAIVGAVAGAASWLFLEGLDRVTEWRVDEPRLLYALPVAGVGLGLVAARLFGREVPGTALVLSELDRPTPAGVPVSIAPYSLGGTWLVHLFGGSVGREGTALQMAGGLADAGARKLRLGDRERRVILLSAVAGGFGSVFGVPATGAVFALERAPGRVRRPVAIASAIIAAFLANAVVGWLGHDHVDRNPIGPGVSVERLAWCAVAGLGFGLAIAAFVWARRRISRWVSRIVPRPWLAPAAGGVVTVVLAAVVGREYLGLSLPLADAALAGTVGSDADFVWKLVFTAVCLGTGYPGGEVTPLFVVGATLGASLAGPLGIDAASLAAVGFVTVFASGARTPVAGAVMAAELFGSRAWPLALAAGLTARLATGPRGIYDDAVTTR